MRFDDMAATVIAQSGDGPDARPVAWRQLVDLVAQARTDINETDTVYGTLRAWRPMVPLAQRMKAAKALAGRPVPAALFAFFAEDGAAVAAPLVRFARYDAAQWRELLPALPPPVRALLRHREDLDAEVQQALASFGATDMVIGAPEAGEAQASDAPPAPDPETGGVDIRALVDRIEAYRREHPLQAVHARAAPEGEHHQGERIEAFRFEAGSDGVVIWVDDAPREPLVGVSLATAAEAMEHGVDGQIAGAYRQRAPFRDGRLSVAGTGAASGEWRASGVPCFNAQDGRFTGYRGTARRPRADEIAHQPEPAGLYGSSLAPDSLRQLVHELRTPLNAILGFAEMIDGQMLGPAAYDYRSRALEIAGEAKRLLGAVEDLDTAAKVDSNALHMERAHVDGAELLERIVSDLAPLARDRGVSLSLSIASGLPPLAADPVALDRMFSRLLAAVIAVTEAEEALDIRLGDAGAEVMLEVQRPASLDGQDERSLLDPGYSPDGDWPDAPLLGLGFALRLVGNLAHAADGHFMIADDRFTLIVPSTLTSAGAGEGNG